MKYKIRVWNIRVQDPYYVQCGVCGTRISGNTKEGVLNRAKGWVYNPDTDTVICEDCQEYEKNT